MTDRELFMRELQQWIIPLSDANSRSTTADTISSQTLNSLRSILAEIEEASVFVAITASIAGALSEGRDKALSIRHLATYLPPSPQVYRRNIESLLRAALSPSIALPVQAYHARLSYALRLTQAIVDAGPAPTNSVRDAEIDKVEDAWRHVCGTALASIAVLRETLASVRYSRPPVNNEHAEALLRSAKAGGRPCIGEDGKVRMPRWAENRVHDRHHTDLKAWVHMAGGIKMIAIENASRTGLGVHGLGEIAPSTRVSIHLDTGERLSGRVMWARGERAGIQLDDMLPQHHALLANGGAKRPS